MLTDVQRNALFLELHRQIERVAAETAEVIAGIREPQDLAYPPNGGFTPEDLASLRSGGRGPAAVAALRKLVADAAAWPVFHFCSLLDGVADPESAEGAWPTFHITEASDDECEGVMLHDAFMDGYWLWRDARPDPGWKLDSFNDGAKAGR